VRARTGPWQKPRNGSVIAKSSYIEVEIAYIADDDSYLAIELHGQRVQFQMETLERLMEEGRAKVEDG
jgi:hypothetical protein